MPGHYKSSLSLSREEIKPYALAAVQKYSGRALVVGDVLRLVDQAVLAEHGEQALYSSSQIVALALQDLAGDPEIQVFRRRSTREQDGDVVFIGGGVYTPYLYSDTEPVPAYDALVHAEISRFPAPRLNPDHGRVARKARQVSPETAQSDRAELIVSLVRELARDADEALEVESYHREIQKLTQLNEKLRTERDDAVRQLKAIAKAQRTIQDMLNG